MVTGMPTLAKFIAMPPPMVPAPSTPTLRIGRGATSAGTPGILVAARSAKNRWRSAPDSGEVRHASNSCASSASPWSNGSVAAACTQRTMRCGAG